MAFRIIDSVEYTVERQDSGFCACCGQKVSRGWKVEAKKKEL